MKTDRSTKPGGDPYRVELPDPKVLFVDDEASILKALRRLCVEEDFEVFTAGSGPEGLSVLEQNPDVSVIVSDQRMPGMSGVEFLERSLEIAPDAVRMVLTGYADVNAAIGAINRGGAYRYISKPWNDEEMLATLREGIDLFRLRRENQELHRIVLAQNEELQSWNAQLELYVQEQTMEIQKKNDDLRALNERLRRSFNDTLAAFSNLLELRHEATESHARNVAETARRLAEASGCPPGEQETVRVAALLHDIGKIGLPDVLFLKAPSGMNADELRQYRRHPVRGQAALDAVSELRDAGLLIRHHHENFDGTGFPDRLKGEAIPLGARIIALADEADRRIQADGGPASVEKALAAMRGELGGRLDPGLFAPLPEIVRAVYADLLAEAPGGEIELAVADLSEGLVLSRDARSGTGILLLKKGTRLDARKIAALRRYDRLDPARTGVFVRAPAGGG